ncbi:acetyl-CoA synthetase-like protein [Marasmius fiardii PR-910]|nr:acetyl-CoA synthetase-like protein [Marasmius fiardii PR-910]
MASSLELALQAPIPTPPQTQALSCTTFRPPVLDGSLNLLDMCDWHYKHSPNHPMFVFSRQDGTTRTITWREAISAVYRGVKLVQDRFGVESLGSEPPVVGIAAQSDPVETIAYNISQLSLMRTNFIPFLISTRNSLDTVVHLLATARVQYILVSGDEHSQQLLEQAIDVLRSKSSQETLPKISPMFLFEEFFSDLDETPPPGPPPRKNPQDVAILIQSSSSTSQYPKIIPRIHRKLLETCTGPYYGGKDLANSVMSLHSLPMLYGVAVGTLCIMASCGIATACFEPRFPPTVPTPSNVLEASESTGFLEEWNRQPEKLRWLLKNEGYLAYTGSALEKEVGDKLASEGISVMTQYGATTLMFLPKRVKSFLSFWHRSQLTYPPESRPGKEWEYFQFSENVDVKLVSQGDDGTFEVVAKSSPRSVPVFTNVKVDGVDGYATGDLVVPHPTRSGFWKLHGRTDDQIVHTSGEKTNPTPLEAILRQNPLIRGVVLFGKDQAQVGALLDLKEHQAYPADDLWDSILPTVEKMNAYAPIHSKLLKEMILFANPDKPFKYTGKGTARRPLILEDYKDEITKLYEGINNFKSSNRSE